LHVNLNWALCLSIVSFDSFTVIAPRPIDQEPNEANFIGVVIVVLTTIIILLVAIILFIVSRTKRARGSNVLDAFQYSFNPNTLGGNVDKHRPNGNSIKVSITHTTNKHIYICTYIEEHVVLP